MNVKKPLLLALIPAVTSAGCLMGPTYQRPAVNAPAAYRDAPADNTGASLGAEKWFDLFQDPQLQALLKQAVSRNFDVRIAAARVAQAQEQVGITRAAEFPMVNAGANTVDERNPKIASVFPSYSTGFGELDLSVLWNLDFWGRYRRATEVARDQLLATQWGQKAVVSSVVAQVAENYFQLRALDDQLATAQQTLAARQDSVKMTQILEQNGGASQLDLSQANQLVAQASAEIPQLQEQIAQQENLLSILLGANPGPIARGATLDQQPNPPSVPAGLPSELLERRPDVQAAEATLRAANAEIGVARAAMFPNIALTGDGGLESYALNRLFTSAARQWNVTAAATQPVFAAGSLRAAVRYTEAERQQMLLTYQKTIQQAFQQVSDALVALNKNYEIRQQQESLVKAAQQTAELSDVLYKNGGASYLQVLTAQTNQFTAELTLSQAELNERLALVQLYNALGGGWN